MDKHAIVARISCESPNDGSWAARKKTGYIAVADGGTDDHQGRRNGVMPTITIDNQRVHCRDGIPVLQAVLEMGRDVPHYCYHPGLTIVASCRLCLMEMKVPNLKTR